MYDYYKGKSYEKFGEMRVWGVGLDSKKSGEEQGPSK
jgi:hypothetical protein